MARSQGPKQYQQHQSANTQARKFTCVHACQHFRQATANDYQDDVYTIRCVRIEHILFMGYLKN